MLKLVRRIRGFRCLVPGAAFLCIVAMQVCFAGSCKISVGELPITMVNLRPQVTAKFNGKEVSLNVDSGAFFGVISPASAAELNLPIYPAPWGFDFRGVNGSTPAWLTRVKEFSLAGWTLHNVEFLVAGSQTDSGSVGVLGQNVLQVADVDYDLAQGVIRLIRSRDCNEKTVITYWAGGKSIAYSEMNVDSRGRRAVMGHASLNGSDIRVIFDSGAGVSTLTLRAAARAGIRPDSPGVISAGPMGGWGRNTTPSFIASFESFKIGDEEIRHARLRFAEMDLGDADMLIGPDFFLSHRIYFATTRQKLYFTYNGGPVFDLRHTGNGGESPAVDVPVARSPADEPGPAAAQSSAAQEPKAPAANLNDAADYSRRGTAMAARGDYEHALTALSRACELAPENADYFYQRSIVYLRTGHPLLANQDLDQTLTLDPHRVAALVSRAELLLANGDTTAAIRDLDAADQIAAKQEDLRYEMGASYVRADRLSAAVAQFDLWIAAHQDDWRIPSAENLRCWSRALGGVDLSLALKDCSAALKRAEKGSSFYAEVSDSRGLVFLRLEDYPKSIADYDAAIKIAPKKASSWYGRGIDKVREHQIEAGDADIVQARSLAPKIADSFSRHGVEP